MFPNVKEINKVKNIFLLNFNIFPIKNASVKPTIKNKEFAVIKIISSLKEKEELIKAKNIRAGKPIFKTYSFKTFDHFPSTF